MGHAAATGSDLRPGGAPGIGSPPKQHGNQQEAYRSA
jgi:hypothetical protein